MNETERANYCDGQGLQEKNSVQTLTVTILAKMILTVMKQLKQLQRKSRKKSGTSSGFEPMISAIPV